MAAVRGQAFAWPDFQVGRFLTPCMAATYTCEKVLVGSFLKLNLEIAS
ncbi:hypothetical protein JET68_07990 [Pseudomonas monteilii]|nr:MULTISPECIES: hypothetical protein [Pseudomonas]MBI6918737.1 hypothetical protein [Pseudomonas monteilii]MCE0937315.1 hypothetical protein [Pseudomonas kurunegalensis]